MGTQTGPGPLLPCPGSWEEGQPGQDLGQAGPVRLPKFHLKQATAPPSYLAQVSPPPARQAQGWAGSCLLEALGEASREGTLGTGPRSRDSEDCRLEAAAAARARWTRPRAPAAMQDSNFLLSALQPEAGVCSLALPSDLQLDRRGTQGPEAERLRAARVQEQVRARLLQLGQQQRHNGTAEPGTVAGVARGRQMPAGWAAGGGEGGGRQRWRRRARWCSDQRPRCGCPGPSSLTHRPALSHPPRPGCGAGHGWGLLPPHGDPASPSPACLGPTCTLSPETPVEAGRTVSTWRASQAHLRWPTGTCTRTVPWATGSHMVPGTCRHTRQSQ